MTQDTFVPDHVLNASIGAADLDIQSQNIAPQADGSVNLLAVKKPESASALAPNPTLSNQEVAALTYAFKRTMQRLQPSGPSSSGARGKKRGLSWTSNDKPLRIPASSAKYLSQINMNNPTVTLDPLLRFFKGLTDSSIQLNVRKSDMSAITRLQYMHGISKSMPRPSIFERRRALGPQRYRSLVNTPSSSAQVVEHTIHGRQVQEMSQASGLTHVLRARAGGSRNPGAYAELNDVAKLFEPTAPTLVRGRKRTKTKEATEQVGFNPPAMSFPTPAPK